MRTEEPGDYWGVEALFDLSFAPGREALSSYRLREGVAPVGSLCLVVPDADAIVGALRTWPVTVSAQPALLIGPLAVHPTRQGEGLAGAMMREALARATEAGHARAMLVGNAPYYARFGFARLGGVRMPAPTNPDRVLGVSLIPNAWAGVAGPVQPWQAPAPHPSSTPCRTP